MNVLRLYNTKLSSVISSYKPVPLLRSGSRKFSLSNEEAKVSIVEKWKSYWNNLINDYIEVFKETFENAKKTPKKTMMISSLVCFTSVCYKTNPDIMNYRDSVLKCSNDASLVAKQVRNEHVDQFLTSLETCYNFGLIRRISFGVVSFIWIDNYSNELGLYKTSSSYLKPQYLTFFERVVDVGFLGKWWKLERLMCDYDVNEEEWGEKDKKIT